MLFVPMKIVKLTRNSGRVQTLGQYDNVQSRDPFTPEVSEIAGVVLRSTPGRGSFEYSG